MKFKMLSFVTLLASSMTALAQFPPQIKHVVILFQENRTPDNLFHGLSPKCPIPSGASGLKACIPSPVTTSCYDISPCGLSNEKGTPIPITLTPVQLGESVDPDHSHKGFVEMCDPDPGTFACRNDGAYQTSSASYSYVDNIPVTNYDGSPGHLLDPYLTFAKEYGWANFMYQTNQGPSYPAHQFIFSGTSTFTAEDDASAIYVSENFNGKTIGDSAGCLLPPSGIGQVISPYPPAGSNCQFFPGNVQECLQDNTIQMKNGEAIGTFCYPHKSMADLLDPKEVSWKYYAPSAGSIWTAPDSFQAICVPKYVKQPDGSEELECTGSEWNQDVDVQNDGTDILGDIGACDLAGVTWVIPDGKWSDHAQSNPKYNYNYGPSWIAAVINAIGTQPKCTKGEDKGETLWDDTAIFITWDDWGGWSDNQPALYLSQLPCKSGEPCFGDYQYGFRVPLLVVSAYTPANTINNNPHDFGSILRFIEGVNGITETLGFADARAKTDLTEFFSLKSPRKYTIVPAEYPASCFTSKTQQPNCFPVGDPVDPDDH